MIWNSNLMNALARWAAYLSPSCKEAARLQSIALDRKLPMRQRFGLRLHLLLCKWCRRYGKQITFLRNAAHEHADELAKPVAQMLQEEARERIKRRLHIERE